MRTLDQRNMLRPSYSIKRVVPTLLLILSCIAPNLAVAQLRSQESIKDLETLFETRQYPKLISLFKQEIAKNPNSTESFYNLGNCYYHTDSIGNAILAYERALYLSPSDSETRHNLALARRKAFDNASPTNSYLEDLLDSVAYSFRMETALWLGGVAFVLMSICLVAFALSSETRNKKISFYVALACLILSVFFNSLALHQYYYFMKAESEAIVLSFDAQLVDTPSTAGTKITELASGTKVTLLEGNESEYQKVSLPNGQIGWVLEKSIEHIIPLNPIR